MKPADHLPPIHPGEILRELYLEPLEMTPYALAKQLHIPRTRIERIVAERSGITTDTALRLAKFFRTSPEFWMNLQSTYELKVDSKRLADELAAIREIEAA
ncbi:HigA family addiction module antitoxin [Rhizobium sp. C1]|uniref:HigA family addiction module antitoxin n=1 Tax=Rhizobium sp. C1 TaxID=1349799 RepID=UPI001E54F3B6|nr:HigA family addiction module antitoxin [Rhizobium sp. C1]MCD2179617.1 HigA family addiction module antitoxin [Rhizobium sp. C1]